MEFGIAVPGQALVFMKMVYVLASWLPKTYLKAFTRLRNLVGLKTRDK